MNFNLFLIVGRFRGDFGGVIFTNAEFRHFLHLREVQQLHIFELHNNELCVDVDKGLSRKMWAMWHGTFILAVFIVSKWTIDDGKFNDTTVLTFFLGHLSGLFSNIFYIDIIPLLSTKKILLALKYSTRQFGSFPIQISYIFIFNRKSRNLELNKDFFFKNILYDMKQWEKQNFFKFSNKNHRISFFLLQPLSPPAYE